MICNTICQILNANVAWPLLPASCFSAQESDNEMRPPPPPQAETGYFPSCTRHCFPQNVITTSYHTFSRISTTWPPGGDASGTVTWRRKVPPLGNTESSQQQNVLQPALQRVRLTQAHVTTLATWLLSNCRSPEWQPPFQRKQILESILVLTNSKDNGKREANLKLSLNGNIHFRKKHFYSAFEKLPLFRPFPVTIF